MAADQVRQAGNLDPVESSPLPDPDVPQDEDSQEDTHLHQAEQAQYPKLNRPGKKEDGLDIKNDKQDGDNVVADRVAPRASDSGSTPHS